MPLDVDYRPPHDTGRTHDQACAPSRSEASETNETSEVSYDLDIIDAVVEPMFVPNTNNDGHYASGVLPPSATMTLDHGRNFNDDPTATGSFSTLFRSRKVSIMTLCLCGLAAFSVLAACFVVVFRDQDDPMNNVDAEAVEKKFERRLMEVMDVLVEEGLPNPVSFLEPTDPHYRALDWSVYEDLTWTTLSTTEDRNRFLQRYALALFAYSTELDHRMDESSWLQNVNIHECSVEGFVCDDDKNLIAIDVEDLNLWGTLPDELGLVLTNLISFDCTRNRLGGTIPESLYDLNLEYLDLSRNEFSSTISPKIAQMTDLVELILDDNRLTGQLPIESLQQLTRLEVFLISINLLEGRIFDAVMKWPNIQWLGLEDLPLLEVAIPTEIGQLSSLRTFLIQGADPSLPTEIGLLQQLRIFHFTDPYHREEASHSNNNNTTATLPTEIGLLTELVELEFESDGAVSGTIPTEIGHLTNLERLVLDFNAFSGQLPTTLGNLGKLKLASFAECTSLTGTVPPEFGLLIDNLILLELYSTRLEGSLPQEFCTSADLRVRMHCELLTCSCCKNYVCI